MSMRWNTSRCAWLPSPWHGFQYRLEDGCSPPPFSERIAAYPLRLREEMLEVMPRPFPLGSTDGLVTKAEEDRDT